MILFGVDGPVMSVIMVKKEHIKVQNGMKLGKRRVHHKAEVVMPIL